MGQIFVHSWLTERQSNLFHLYNRGDYFTKMFVQNSLSGRDRLPCLGVLLWFLTSFCLINSSFPLVHWLQNDWTRTPPSPLLFCWYTWSAKNYGTAENQPSPSKEQTIPPNTEGGFCRIRNFERTFLWSNRRGCTNEKDWFGVPSIMSEPMFGPFPVHKKPSAFLRSFL